MRKAMKSKKEDKVMIRLNGDTRFNLHVLKLELKKKSFNEVIDGLIRMYAKEKRMKAEAIRAKEEQVKRRKAEKARAKAVVIKE